MNSIYFNIERYFFRLVFFFSDSGDFDIESELGILSVDSVRVYFLEEIGILAEFYRRNFLGKEVIEGENLLNILRSSFFIGFDVSSLDNVIIVFCDSVDFF